MGVFLLVTIKLLIGFFAMVVIINISGKGNLAPSSASDQIINYVFGGVMGGASYNSSVRMPDFIVVLCIWCVFVLSMKWVKKRNLKAKQLIDGKALIIIDDGKIDITNCKKARLSAHDVAFKLRTNGIYSSKAVKRALIEQNGQFIIIQADLKSTTSSTVSLLLNPSIARRLSLKTPGPPTQSLHNSMSTGESSTLFSPLQRSVSLTFFTKKRSLTPQSVFTKKPTNVGKSSVIECPNALAKRYPVPSDPVRG